MFSALQHYISNTSQSYQWDMATGDVCMILSPLMLVNDDHTVNAALVWLAHSQCAVLGHPATTRLCYHVISYTGWRTHHDGEMSISLGV